MNMQLLVRRIILFALLLSIGFSPSSYADPDASDIMNGYPPGSETRVTKANWFIGPYNRWGLQHIREITTTINISRGDGSVTPLPVALEAISDIPLKQMDGSDGTIQDGLDASYTDGFLVLHNGKILSEVYMNSMTETSK